MSQESAYTVTFSLYLPHILTFSCTVIYINKQLTHSLWVPLSQKGIWQHLMQNSSELRNMWMQWKFSIIIF